MDAKKTSSEANNGMWSNEKHVNYLNRMEASFVQKMLLNEAARSSLTYYYTRALPLDRYLPDSFESTCDSKRQPSGRKDIKEGTMSATNNGTNKRKRMRIQCSRPYDTVSQDQVVPQLGGSKSDKHEESRDL